MAHARANGLRDGAKDEGIVRAYLAIESVLFLLIKVCEISSLGFFNNICWYASVVAGTAVALYFFVRYGRQPENARANVIVAGLVTTACADLFLSFIDTDWAVLPGFILFCVTEIIYWAYLGLSLRSLAARVCTAVALNVVLGIAGILSLQNAVGITNIALVLCNAVQALASRDEGISPFFRVGITLFCCCDLCIVARTFTTGIAYDVVALLVWTFYVPAQVLITMSYVKSVRP